MTIRLTAYRWVPPFAQGYVRDLRVRWALEEAGFPYETELVDAAALETERHRAWQPFGLVPAYRDDDVELFESASIVLHIATKSDALMPADLAGRAKVTTWVIAAVNTIEPFAQAVINLGNPSAEDAKEKSHRVQTETMLRGRLTSLSRWLEGKDYLEGRFTAGDLLMTVVLRELVDCGMLAQFPTLQAYEQRCEARPAFSRALEAQMQTFRENAPAQNR